MFLKGLKCKECSAEYPADRSYMCMKCLGPLEVDYDYDRIKDSLDKKEMAERPFNVWRFRELLPVEGEGVTGHHSGWTPLLRAKRLGKYLGISKLYLKDDSTNRPTLSYKDRVVSIAVSRGVELGFETFACASTGNLGNAVSAHCAAAGKPCLIFVPHDIEKAKIIGSLMCGPQLVALKGNYDQVNRLCAQIGDEYGWGFVNVNLRPYYTEGAKTLGYEIAEQLGWKLPDHIVLPTAGGTLLPKVAKAFSELTQLGWVEGEPRVHCAQAEGCAPIVRALKEGLEEIQPVKPSTLAKSIAIGDPADGPYVLQAVRESGGSGVAVSDEEILSAMELLARKEGLLCEPAGGTTLASTMRLIEEGVIKSDHSVVVALTGHAYKALDAMEGRTKVHAVLQPNIRVFKEWYAQQERSQDQVRVVSV
jgi:threonine synthase